MQKKASAFIIVLAALFASCYFPEVIETRIIFEADKSPTVMINYQNISSAEEEEQEIKESFDDLVKDFYGDDFLVEKASEGLAVRKRQLFIKNDQLHAEVIGDAEDLGRLYNFIEIDQERILVYDGDDTYELLETNGKVVKTDRNTLVVWPIESKTIYWKEKLTDLGEQTESKLFYSNVPKMVALFKDYQSKKKN